MSSNALPVLAVLLLAAVAYVLFLRSAREPATVAPRTPGDADPERRARDEAAGASGLPHFSYDEDDDAELTRLGSAASGSCVAHKIVYDDEAEIDEPTHQDDLILVTACAQSDQGQRRKSNEDSVLLLESKGLYVVADGMGGHRGGEVASGVAVETIQKAFESVPPTAAPALPELPRRASELAVAIQSANRAVLARAQQERALEGMGTTVCAAWFARNKKRLYVGHVGDSRLYRLRGGKLHCITSDHTMGQLGISGEGSADLTRAVGVLPNVEIDVILAKPEKDDMYLLCSDGLTKMVTDEELEDILRSSREPTTLATKLVHLANENGGIDNVSAILIRVDDAAEPGGRAISA